MWYLSYYRNERQDRSTYRIPQATPSADAGPRHHLAWFATQPHGALEQARLPILREGQRQRSRADLDSLRESRQSAGAPDPHPQPAEERSGGKPARVRSDAESTEADRAGESGVVQGTEAPAAVRSFFVLLVFHFLKMKDKGGLMPDLLVRSFAPLLLAFQSCFTQPSFRSFWALSCAWILCSGRRSLTRIIQSAQLTQFKHYCSFHRFFSQARWNLDDLGRCVFQLLLPFCDEILLAAVDDTLARKSGRHIWGAGMHHDPLRSTQKRPFFAFGHNFVVFSLQMALPFAPGKYWAFPILVRMYRKRQTHQRAPGKGGKLERKQTGQATAKQYRTRPELALEMIQMVASWIPQRTLRVLGDSEYAGQSISQHLPANAKLISRMHIKAALYESAAKSAKRGRRRKKGQRLLSPLEMA